MPAATALEDMAFSDYGLGGSLFGAETVGSDLANTLLGGPGQGGAYTGGVGGGSSRTAEERQQSILDVNPYVRPGENINLNPITSQRNGGQTGYYFANELGLPASYGNVGTAQAADPATFNPNAQYTSQLPGFVAVDPNATYRLVSGGTNGDVVYSGAGANGLRNVFAQANDLTLADPTNAYWGVEVLDPATGQYRRVAENRGPNGLGIIGDIAGFALPIAAAIATGGASLGIQIAAGAAAGGLGGFLSGNDILRSALLSGATAGLGNVTGLNEAVGGVLNDVGGAVSDAVSNAFVSGATNQAAANATSDIIVNALSNLAQGVGAGVVQGAVGGAVGGAAGSSSASTAGTNDIVVTGNQATGATTGAATTAGTGGLLNAATGTGTTADDTIVVTGNQTTGANTGAATTAGTGGLLDTTTGTGGAADDTIVVTGNQTTGGNTGAATTAGTTGLLNTTTGTGDIVVTGNQTTGGNTGATTTAGTTGLLNTTAGTGDIVVTGVRPGAVTDTSTGAVTGAATGGLLSTTTGTGGTTTSEGDGVLGTGLSLSDLLTLLGVGSGLLGGSGSGTGTTSTYVSPFGTGTGLGTGQDMRANPNITDYERYGFGPEAMFFQPNYSRIFSGGTSGTQAGAGMTTNPARSTVI